MDGMFRPRVVLSVLLLILPVGVGAPGRAIAGERIPDGSFASGKGGWYAYGVASGPTLVDGALCATTKDGTVNPWDAAIGHNELASHTGQGYKLAFRAKATKDVVPNVNFQHASGGYEVIAGGSPHVTAQWQTFTFHGTAAAEFADGQVVFQIGGKGAFTFCIADVSLEDGVATPKYEPKTGPRVRVNQIGYLPYGPKGATLVSNAAAPVKWQLKDSTGAVVREGTTRPRGVDPSSGQKVHTLDFTAFTRAGTGFTLTADGETSYPFDVSSDAYPRLRKDAMTVFYTNRSGIEIRETIAPGYGRKAGHVSVAPNKGDKAVSCQAARDFMNNWTCAPSFVQNVTGGWYDAGDHGKYVVNGAIAVAQLLGEYERSLHVRTADKAALGDSTLRVPETGNGVPDILDEARWELEWMLRMQIAAGATDPGIAPYVGMAFHKVQDESWTGLPLAPAADDKPRELHRPSTAATLDLAAAAAQGARLFAPFDQAFSDKLLAAAKTAYAAARRVPDLYAPAADGASGGGPYDDADLAEERYWAAAELFLTTGDAAFRDEIAASPLRAGTMFSVDGFAWNTPGALAQIDLATVPSQLPGRDKIRASVLKAADALLALQSTQPYAQPYAPRTKSWAWGSNSQILNNIVVLAVAYDLGGAARYRDGAVAGLDYLFGRNALNLSYVTGYGHATSENQHSRLYAHQLEPSLPHPPAGSIAGGPNSSIQDPVAQGKLKGCLPQFCYLDDIQSWSTNEIAINWNSALSWVASWAADLRDGRGPTP